MAQRAHHHTQTSSQNKNIEKHLGGVVIPDNAYRKMAHDRPFIKIGYLKSLAVYAIYFSRIGDILYSRFER